MQSQVLQNSTQLMTTRNGLLLEHQRFTISLADTFLLKYLYVCQRNVDILAILLNQVEKGVNTALTCLTNSNKTCVSSVVKFSQVRKCVIFILRSILLEFLMFLPYFPMGSKFSYQKDKTL